MSSVIKIATVLTVGIAPIATFANGKTQRPNVIVILCDDLGSADVGFSGCTDIPTPHIDRIASSGVVCTNAYVSAPYSGPSRSGLFTGRYQQRFGAEANIIDHNASLREGHGVPTDELMLSEIVKQQGYKTAVVGKWHMGDDEAHSPLERGADYFYGFTGGDFDFWGFPNVGQQQYLMENERRVPPKETKYLTDDFTDKAVEFIDKNRDDNFFLFLSYNAPHAPFQATQEYLDRTKHIYDPWRSIYTAMVLGVDDGVGRIWQTLEQNELEDNTIIIFLSDNGGINLANNNPSRAWKGNMFEGGIRTPFAFYWKSKIKAGSVYENYISALDIFPTVATAAGCDVAALEKPLDGVDLVPYFRGKNKKAPHNKLFWRTCGGFEWAVRSGDYKAVKSYHNESVELYNVKEDKIEMTNLADQMPELTAELTAAYEAWSSEMVAPAWTDPHQENQILDYKAWVDSRKKALRPTSK